MVDRDDDDIPAIDLRALDPHRDTLLADRVIGAAMVQIRASARPPSWAAVPASVLGDVAQWWYPAVAAAALVAVVAGVAVIRNPRMTADRAVNDVVEARLVEWARSGHVPTNADLLSAFAGAPR
ncbi:MAG TPA: hypothetical protein VII52_04865 [Gemmatimonadaceae bacterium]